MTYFCSNIRYFLDVNGISVLKFNEDIGLSVNTLRSWERYDRIPKSGTILKIAEYFGVSPDDLLTKDLRIGFSAAPSVNPSAPQALHFADNNRSPVSSSLDLVLQSMSEEEQARVLEFALRIKLPHE